MPKNNAWDALKVQLKIVDAEVENQLDFVRDLQDKVDRAKAALDVMRTKKQEIKAAMDLVEAQP